MKLGRCPTCHSHIGIEQIAQDEAASALLKMLAQMDGDLSRPVVSYLSLFRPEKRDLSHERALKLCMEVLELSADTRLLAGALSQTVETIRSKGGGPLKNHNYLKRVIEGMEKIGLPQACAEKSQQRGKSKTEQAFLDLENMKQ